MFFTIEKIEQQLKALKKAIYRETAPISNFKYHEGDCPGAQRLDFDDRSWADFKVGDTWGGYDVTAWFRARIDIPASFRDQKVVVHLLVGPRDGGGSTAETLLYVNGAPLQGIDIWHDEAWLPPKTYADGPVCVALKAWSGVIAAPERRCFRLAELAVVDEATETYYHLAANLVKSVRALDENDLRRAKLVAALDQSARMVDWFKPQPEALYASVREALRCLLEKVVAFEDVEEIKPKVTAIGHSHIDMAWLWRLKDTREKTSRTFSTVLHLMRQYPEYVYLHSSPQLYQFLKTDYPEIYAQIKGMVAAGRWEVDGGMWVEADTNLTGGESLVRQFLLGKRFIREEFGIDMHTLWLPDVFGYSGALPQIMAKSGIRHFLTSKISWSQYNRFPYDTFHWRGIDGSEVLTHFVTTPEENSRFYTYNGQLTPGEVKGLWDNYRQKDLNDELLLLYGNGDGGGGPTKEMLETARALKNLPGLPGVRLGRTDGFFERLEKRTGGKTVPVWDGELYLEYHRGTYTSQGFIKRANRQAESLLHEAEWLCATVDLLSGECNYPRTALRKAWELTLLNQFHDILPGSSIHPVYEDCRKDYAAIQEICERAIGQAITTIQEDMTAERAGVVTFNSLAWERDGIIAIPWSAEIERQTILVGEETSLTQVVEEDGQKKLLVEAQDVPAMGYRNYPLVPIEAEEPARESARMGSETTRASIARGSIGGVVNEFAEAVTAPAPAPEPGLVVTPERMENRFFRVVLNERGQITSLWDKLRRREIITEGGRGNVLQAFEDRPMNFDAWDIDIYYQDKLREVTDLVEAVVEESGPIRGALRLRWKFLDSEIAQRVTLYRGSPRIDFRTEVDWHEHQVLLKVAFPVAIRATRAAYDIQFGAIERPTHWNTSWDAARFEVVGHKWADLSEGDYGVSLLNDCKYGYDIKDQVMRLTLIKSGIEPDPMADQGRHAFTYSLLPHTGDWRTGGVVREAYELNHPMRAVVFEANEGGGLPGAAGFVRADAENVIVETVKKAEDGEAWVIRIYESRQCRSNEAHLEFCKPVRRAVECNLMEEEEKEAEFEGNKLRFAIQPYEIKTFMVWMEGESDQGIG